MKKVLSIYTSLIFLFVLTVGVTFAAFTDSARILGTSFGVGSGDIKLIDNLTGPIQESNAVDEKQGPVFTSVGSDWEEDYLVMVFNNATSDVVLTFVADYETVNDPENLRDEIHLEIFDWDDMNLDGMFTEDELGVSWGRKSILRWKNDDPMDMGQLVQGDVSRYVFRFDTDSLSESKQGASALFDFEFSSITL